MIFVLEVDYIEPFTKAFSSQIYWHINRWLSFNDEIKAQETPELTQLTN